MMNCFCGMVDRRKGFSLISSRDHCQRSSPSRISDTPRAGFEPAQNLSSGLVERSCAAVITPTPQRQNRTKLVVFLIFISHQSRLRMILICFQEKSKIKWTLNLVCKEIHYLTVALEDWWRLKLEKWCYQYWKILMLPQLKKNPILVYIINQWANAQSE